MEKCEDCRIYWNATCNAIRQLNNVVVVEDARRWLDKIEACEDGSAAVSERFDEVYFYKNGSYQPGGERLRR